MNKKQICNNNETFAYYSGCGGIEFKYIDYDIENYIYFIANAWYGKKSYHKAKIYYNTNIPYIIFNNQRISLNECIRTNI